MAVLREIKLYECNNYIDIRLLKIKQLINIILLDEVFGDNIFRTV